MRREAKIVCAAVVAGLWAPPALAADAITLALGGRIKQFFFVADQDKSATENFNAVGMFNDTRIAVEGRTVLDNGITIRAYARFIAEARVNSNVDEAYVDINSTFGRLRMGEKSGANTSIIGDPVPQAFLSVDDELLGDALQARTGITLRDGFTFKRFTGNALGVSYQSPELLGVRLGVAYHPTTEAVAGPVDNRLRPHNAYDVTAGYEGDLPGGTYRISGGYFHVSPRNGGIDGREAWNIAVGLTYGGWELAGAYINVQPTSGFNEQAWTIGALYGIGPWQISADYRSARRRILPGVNEHADRTTLQTAYKLGPGISLGLMGFYGDQTDAAGIDWDGGGVLGGIKIDF